MVLGVEISEDDISFLLKQRSQSFAMFRFRTFIIIEADWCEPLRSCNLQVPNSQSLRFFNRDDGIARFISRASLDSLQSRNPKSWKRR